MFHCLLTSVLLLYVQLSAAGRALFMRDTTGSQGKGKLCVNATLCLPAVPKLTSQSVTTRGAYCIRSPVRHCGTSAQVGSCTQLTGRESPTALAHSASLSFIGPDASLHDSPPDCQPHVIRLATHLQAAPLAAASTICPWDHYPRVR